MGPEHIVGYCLAKNHQKILGRLPILFGDEIDEDSHELELLGLQFIFNPIDQDAPELLAVEEAFGEGVDVFDDETLRETIVPRNMLAATFSASPYRLSAIILSLKF